MKEEEVQSNLLGEMILSSGVGISTGILAVSGFDLRNFFDWFLEILYAAVFNMPVICEADILTSRCAEKNHRQHNKCITVGSLEEPLLIESTSLLLLHLNSTLVPDRSGPHTTQLSTIGMSSFIMMSL